MGDLIGQTTNVDTTFVLQDGQGSSRITIDASGTTQDILTFDAFGNRMDGFGRAAADTTTVNHLYVGELYDEEAGLYHLRARDYDPAIGRFTSMDEFEGVAVSLKNKNKYLYVDNDPINNFDPSGHFGIGAVLSGINTTFILANVFITSYSVTSNLMEGNYGDAAIDLLISVTIGKLGGYAASSMRPTIARALGFFARALRSTKTVNLYRAVSPAEYYSIMNSGRISTKAGAFEGKQFAFTMEEALRYANTSPEYAAIIRITVKEEAIKLGNFQMIDSFIFKNGVLTFEGIETVDAVNKFIVGVAHVF